LGAGVAAVAAAAAVPPLQTSSCRRRHVWQSKGCQSERGKKACCWVTGDLRVWVRVCSSAERREGWQMTQHGLEKLVIRDTHD